MHEHPRARRSMHEHPRACMSMHEHLLACMSMHTLATHLQQVCLLLADHGLVSCCASTFAYMCGACAMCALVSTYLHVCVPIYAPASASLCTHVHARACLNYAHASAHAPLCFCSTCLLQACVSWVCKLPCVYMHWLMCMLFACMHIRLLACPSIFIDRVLCIYLHIHEVTCMYWLASRFTCMHLQLCASALHNSVHVLICTFMFLYVRIHTLACICSRVCMCVRCWCIHVHVPALL